MSLLRYKEPKIIEANGKKVIRMNGSAYTKDDEVIYTEFVYTKLTTTIDI